MISTKESRDQSKNHTLPKFKRRVQDDCNLWRFRLKSVLRGNQYWKSLNGKDCPVDIQEKAEAILVSAVGDAA